MLSAKTEMLIRKPVDEVFEAFVDPAITSRFWFTGGSGRLEAGKSVRWDWAMYDFSTNAVVKEIEPNRSSATVMARLQQDGPHPIPLALARFRP